MKIVIPPIWLKTARSQQHFFAAISLILLVIGILVLMTTVSLNEIGLLFLLLAIVLVFRATRMLRDYDDNARCQHEIEITKQNVICTKKVVEKAVAQWIIKLEDRFNAENRLNLPRSQLIYRRHLLRHELGVNPIAWRLIFRGVRDNLA